MKNENQGPIQKDDPRITSYVLGERAELTNRECDEIRTLLDSDPQLRAEVEGLSAFAEELQAEMAAEPAVELSSAQRDRIAQAAAPAVGSFMPRLVGGSLLAASVVFGAFQIHRLTAPVQVPAKGDQLAQAELQVSVESASLEALSGLGYTGNDGPIDVTNGLEDMASLGLDNEGTGSTGRNASGNPSSGFSYDDGLDGAPSEEAKGRITSVSPSQTSANNREPKEMHREQWKRTFEDLSDMALPEVGPRKKQDEIQDRPGGSALGGGGGAQVASGPSPTGSSGPRTLGTGGPSTPGPSAPVSPERPGFIAGRSDSLTTQVTPRGERGRGAFQAQSGGEAEFIGTAEGFGERRNSGGETDGYLLRSEEKVSSNESYEAPPENRFTRVDDDPLSTFSIDVDTAGYANVRRFLTQGQRPPAAAVRLEEMVNYFSYDYPQPTGNDPFSVTVETANCPWAEGHRLMQVGLKGKQFSDAREKGRNLVFLMDVSGSMNSANKLPLLKKSFEMLLDHMSSTDRVAIVVYAGAAGVVLPSTQAANRGTILGALGNLQAGGSTNGGAGIQLAYSIAQENFIKGGINRVILATDGDFNVGRTDRSSLVSMIEEKAKSGVFLTVLGYGMGNLKDSTMEQLADKGNGNYAYIDNLNEARKVLVTEADATLETIAKDVKIQLEFNPGIVAAWRLVGYENRVLAHQDFNDDTKDAGEIGAGHTVTAIYEIVPVGMSINLPGVDPLKYQQSVTPKELTQAAASGEMLTVKLRYKQPDGDTSQLIEVPVHDARRGLAEAPADFRFACAVAGFGMILKGSQYKGSLNIDLVRELALAGAERDPFGYRHEFLQLVERARQLGVK